MNIRAPTTITANTRVPVTLNATIVVFVETENKLNGYDHSWVWRHRLA